MSETKVEIRFNSKSSGQGVADALKIAYNHEKSFDGKMCIVKFASLEENNIEKILKAVGGLKHTKVLIDGVEYSPRKVNYTLFCDKKLLCKGVCSHISFGFDSIDRFLLRFQHRIKENQLTGDQLITKSTQSLDPEKLIREIVPIPDEKLSDLYTSLAEYASKTKQLEYSRRAFELDKKYISDSNELAESYYWYAETLMEHDQLDEAVKVLKDGIKKFEDDIFMHDILLRAFVKKKQFEEALKQVDLILAMDPGWMDDYIDKAEFAPLRALPKYEAIVKKHEST